MECKDNVNFPYLILPSFSTQEETILVLSTENIFNERFAVEFTVLNSAYFFLQKAPSYRLRRQNSPDCHYHIVHAQSEAPSMSGTETFQDKVVLELSPDSPESLSRAKPRR